MTDVIERLLKLCERLETEPLTVDLMEQVRDCIYALRARLHACQQQVITLQQRRDSLEAQLMAEASKPDEVYYYVFGGDDDEAA
jgi:hypothetical protein